MIKVIASYHESGHSQYFSAIISTTNEDQPVKGCVSPANTYKLHESTIIMVGFFSSMGLPIKERGLILSKDNPTTHYEMTSKEDRDTPT